MLIEIEVFTHAIRCMQVLADIIDLPCRIAKGCKYCNRDDAASCLVRFGLDRYDTSDWERTFIFLFAYAFCFCKTPQMFLKILG